jgi:hypothetical protein
MGDGMSKLVFGLIGTLAMAWTALVGWSQWVNAHRIMDDPANESCLYRSYDRYDPKQVIKQFMYVGEGYSSGHSHGSGHLVKSIQHTQDFTENFAMQANQERELLNALREDIVLRLRMTGMTVVAANDKANGGFTYKYTSGNSSGSISVQIPVHPMTMRSYYPSLSELDDVELNIALKETWTRPASETQWWMSAVD